MAKTPNKLPVDDDRFDSTPPVKVSRIQAIREEQRQRRAAAPDPDYDDQDDPETAATGVYSFNFQGQRVQLIAPQGVREISPDRLTYIDLNNIVGEVVTFSTVINRLGLMLAEANQRFREAELNKKMKEAQFKDALRATEKPEGSRGWTGDMLHDKWYGSTQYLKYKGAANKAQFEADILNNAYWACKDKSEKLKHISNRLTPDDLASLNNSVVNNFEIIINSNVFDK